METKNLNKILNEFINIFKHEEIITIHNINKYNIDEGLEDYIKKSNVLFLINAEYDAPTNECVLNYYNKYGGNQIFNELMKTHKLNFQWYNNYYAVVYSN